MNYYLHNMGYDKPINFREIVLWQYHRNCVWLRDTNFDKLSLTSYKLWLPDLECYENELQAEKCRLQKYKSELDSLTDARIQELYAEEISKIECLHQCNNSYHVDEIAKIKRCTDEYNKSLQKWLAIPNTPKYLTDALVDIYETAIEDMAEHERDEVEAVKNMHSKTIPNYEDFKKQIINHYKGMVEFSKNQVLSKTNTVKIVKQNISDIKQLFAWLDSIEKENNK